MTRSVKGPRTSSLFCRVFSPNQRQGTPQVSVGEGSGDTPLREGIGNSGVVQLGPGHGGKSTDQVPTVRRPPGVSDKGVFHVKTTVLGSVCGATSEQRSRSWAPKGSVSDTYSGRKTLAFGTECP